MQKTPVFFLLAILLLCFTTPAGADDAVIYDSGELTINRWHVHLSGHTIELNLPGKVYLNIGKNTPGADIRAGLLLVGHQPIPLTRFLKGSDTAFHKEIELGQTTRLRVFLTGSPGASITIAVHVEEPNRPSAAVAFSASPETIDAGTTSTLSWSSEHADSCVIDPGIGAVDVAGSLVVSPATTTTYTITANGPGGTASAKTAVTVTDPPPAVTLSANPAEIVRGESATLS